LIAITEGKKLYVVNAAGTTLQVLMEEDQTIRPVGGVVWSPDGQYLAFIADLKQNCKLCRQVGLITVGGGIIRYLQVSPNEVADLPRWTQDGRLLVNIHRGEPDSGTTYVYTITGDSQIASGTYILSSSHEGQKWYPWLPGKTWTVDQTHPHEYYQD
jgi:Tol biopolymer transport system component